MSSGSGVKNGSLLEAMVLDKAYGNGEGRNQVLSRVSLDVRQGEILAVLGPSGCGKTTLLHILAGFTRADAGKVLVDGREVVAPGGGTAVVFQEDALFPWLTVMENLHFGLWARGTPRGERERMAGDMLARVGLAGRGGLLPRELSGGMKQRVALARVLALEPRLLLMDEPFASLDALTREEMQDLLLSLHASLGLTVVLVTHDVAEAVHVADRALILGRNAPGILAEVPLDLPRPRDPDGPGSVAMQRRLRASLRS